MAERLVHVSRIEPHPSNIRRDVGDVTELAASIRAAGLLQPLVVSVHPQRPGFYQLLAGHRRLAAAKVVRLDQVPVIIRAAPEQPEAIMLIENCQRTDLGAVEKAEAMGALQSAGWSVTRIARETGLAISTVSYYLSLLDLDQASLDRIRNGQVPVGAAVTAVRGTRAANRRAQGKPPRKASIAADHFSCAHPLSLAARAVCRRAGHGGRKHGGACGQCWETVIRADAVEALKKAAS